MNISVRSLSELKNYGYREDDIRRIKKMLRDQIRDDAPGLQEDRQEEHEEEKPAF